MSKLFLTRSIVAALFPLATLSMVFSGSMTAFAEAPGAVLPADEASTSATPTTPQQQKAEVDAWFWSHRYATPVASIGFGGVKSKTGPRLAVEEHISELRVMAAGDRVEWFTFAYSQISKKDDGTQTWANRQVVTELLPLSDQEKVKFGTPNPKPELDEVEVETADHKPTGLHIRRLSPFDRLTNIRVFTKRWADHDKTADANPNAPEADFSISGIEFEFYNRKEGRYSTWRVGGSSVDWDRDDTYSQGVGQKEAGDQHRNPVEVCQFKAYYGDAMDILGIRYRDQK